MTLVRCCGRAREEGVGRRGAVGRAAARALVGGVSIKLLARRSGLSRNTIRAALRSSTAPRYRRERSGSKLDPFKNEIHELLKRVPSMPGQRVRELIAPLGFDGGKTIVDDYLREVRPLFRAPRTYQRTIYRPGEICQFDLWQPAAEIPVGYGQTRRAWVVVACLGYSRAGAGALVFSKQIPELLFGIRRCFVVARRAAQDAGLGPPGRAARRRRPPDSGVCRLLRGAEARLVLLRARRPAR